MVGEPRRRSPRWSVRARILAVILLVTTVGIGVTGTVSFLVQRDLVVRGVDDELERQLEAARGVVAVGSDGMTSARDALAAILSAVPPPANGSALGVLDGRAALAPGTPVAFELDAALVDRIVAELADGAVRIGTAVVDGAELRYVATPVTVADDTGIYIVAIDLSRELQPTVLTATVFAVVGAVALAAIGLAGWLVAGRLLRPVRLLGETAERITATDVRERIPVEGHDDLSRLTETINDMLDRLDDAVRQQRELLDDVRHELRTPLTVVRGHLELTDPADPEDVRNSIRIATEELERMGDLVDGLAALAELRAAPLRLEELDVSALTRDVAARVAGIRGRDWRLVAVAEGTLLADRARVVQAMLQFADNADKYAPAGTPVELGSAIVDDRVRLWVRDHGPGIPEPTRARIFERFVRVDRDARGSGLGLSIVAGIAQSHGGSATVEAADAGSRFVLTLPLGGPS